MVPILRICLKKVDSYVFYLQHFPKNLWTILVLIWYSCFQLLDQQVILSDDILSKLNEQTFQTAIRWRSHDSTLDKEWWFVKRLVFFFFYFFFCQENFMKNLSGKFHEKLCLHFLCLLYSCAKIMSALFVSIFYFFFVRKIS